MPISIDLFNSGKQGRKVVTTYEISRAELCKALGYNDSNVESVQYDDKRKTLTIKAKGG